MTNEHKIKVIDSLQIIMGVLNTSVESKSIDESIDLEREILLKVGEVILTSTDPK